MTQHERKLSIGHLTASLSANGSGVKSVVESLSRETYAAGHSVRVFGFDEPGRESEWSGAPAVRTRQRGPSAVGYAPGMWPAISQFKPEIIHAHGLWLLFAIAARKFKRRYRAPYVISPHGMLAKAALEIKPIRKTVARRLYQDRLLNEADCLVATSEIEVDHVREAGYRRPVAIIPLGVDDAPPATSFAETGTKRVIYIGRKLELKGLDRLLEAWQSLSEQFQDWTLDIIGPDSGGYEAVLQALIEHHSIPRVALRAPVSGTAREAAYCSSQLSILPSRSENFALTVAESLMRGVPVIATTATPWKDLNTQECGLCISGSVEALTDALANMMTRSATERFDMGRRGRAWILRDFQWPVMAERHHQLYRWLLGQAARPEFVVTT